MYKFDIFILGSCHYSDLLSPSAGLAVQWYSFHDLKASRGAMTYWKDVLVSMCMLSTLPTCTKDALLLGWSFHGKKAVLCSTLDVWDSLTLKKEAAVFGSSVLMLSCFQWVWAFHIIYTMVIWRGFIYFNAIDPANSCGEMSLMLWGRKATSACLSNQQMFGRRERVPARLSAFPHHLQWSVKVIL